MKIIVAFGISLLVFQMAFAQKIESVFDVEFKNKKIGTLHATEVKTDKKIVRDIQTKTDTKIIAISIHVESEVSTTHEDGILISGTAYRHVSRGAQDIHARVTKSGNRAYQRERNGKKDKLENTTISFCVVDLFFREPKGIKSIFSNMYGDFLKVEVVSAGVYKLITPDDKNSIYTYQNNKLVKVESNTPLGKVISKRI